jgi:hypothetical protein
LIEKGRVKGVRTLDCHTGSIEEIECRFLILATGGAGQLFKYNTNSNIATGDGISLAYNAGAEMRNAEFGNFYDVINKGTGIPIVFGFSCLYNAQGEKISSKYISRPAAGYPNFYHPRHGERGYGRKRPHILRHGRVCQILRGWRGNISMGKAPVQSAFGCEFEKVRQYGPPQAKELKCRSGLPASSPPSRLTVK